MSLSFQTLVLSFFTLLVLMIFICYNRISSNNKTKKNLPPSPPRFPIIGNLHQLGSTPHLSLSALAQKHGSFMSIRLGSVPVVVASSSESAREIMKTHDLIFSGRPQVNIWNILSYGAKTVSFSPYGEYWRQMKSIYVLHLLSAKRVQSFHQVREDETTLMIDMIRKRRGSVINLSDFLFSLTNDVICQIALGRKYNQERFKDLMDELTEVLGVFSIGTYIPSLSWMDRLSGLEGRALKVAKENDTFFEDVIEEHLDRKQGITVDGGSHKSIRGQDMVDIILEVQKENATTSFPIHRDAIKAILMEIFIAGSDTTFTSLEWTISELIRHPGAMIKLQQEVKDIAQGKPKITEEDLKNKHYPFLKAVIKEAMRLHPPIPLVIGRESREDVKLMGYDISARTQVIINIWAIGRDPSFWENAKEFRPERFLNSSIDFKGLHFELLPFGAGRRGCPGLQFAMAVNELALANLVNNFDFTLPNGRNVEELDMSEAMGVTFRKKSPLLVVATPRF